MNEQKYENVYSILERIMLLCRDDGKHFIVEDRLNEINEIMTGSVYRMVEQQGLFRLFAKRPLEEIQGPVILVSSHVDCEEGINECFCEDLGDGFLKGTFDNAATNAAVLSVMLEGSLPDNVLIAFTGDEERHSRGAIKTVEFLRSSNLTIDLAVVLDVTDMGWDEGADFTVENNFWREDQGKQIIGKAKELGYKWRFVPEDLRDIPAYVPSELVIHEEAEEDESWKFDDLEVPCFSLCLPVKGNMHSNAGVRARKDSFPKYCSAMSALLSR